MLARLGNSWCCCSRKCQCQRDLERFSKRNTLCKQKHLLPVQLHFCSALCQLKIILFFSKLSPVRQTCRAAVSSQCGADCRSGDGEGRREGGGWSQPGASGLTPGTWSDTARPLGVSGFILFVLCLGLHGFPRSLGCSAAALSSPEKTVGRHEALPNSSECLVFPFPGSSGERPLLHSAHYVDEHATCSATPAARVEHSARLLHLLSLHRLHHLHLHQRRGEPATQDILVPISHFFQQTPRT